MPDRVTVDRHLELKRGGMGANNAAPITTLEMMNGSGRTSNRGDVVVLQKSSPVAGTLQVETATIVGTITTAGNATIVVTAVEMPNTPKTISVGVLVDDTASTVADKVRRKLITDPDVSSVFDVSGTGASVILTSKYKASNDSTLNVSSDNGTCAGLTTQASSANTTSGTAASGSSADLLAYTTTTSGNDRAAIGMVYDKQIYPGRLGMVQIWGPTDALKADGTTDIAVGDYLSTFTTAKIAQKSTGVGAFAVALEAYTADDSLGVLDAFIITNGAVPRPPS